MRDYVPVDDPEYPSLAAAQRRGNGFRDYIPAAEVANVKEATPRQPVSHDEPDVACETCGRKFRGKMGLKTHLRVTSCGGKLPEKDLEDEPKTPEAKTGEDEANPNPSPAGDSEQAGEIRDVTATDAGSGVS